MIHSLLAVASCLWLSLCTPERSMRELESWIRSKAGEDMRTCEDGMVVGEHYCAVVDGATSPTGRRWTSAGLTGGQWAANILCEAIPNLKPTLTPQQAIQQLTDAIQQAYRCEEGALEVVTANPEERATACLIVYSKHRHEIFVVGDCQAIVLDDQRRILQTIQPVKHNDVVMSQARSMMLQIERLLDQNKNKNTNNDDDDTDNALFEELRQRDQQDIGRALIRPLLLGQRLFQNNLDAPKPFRYWAMDGFPIREEGIEVFALSPDAKEIVLASDGYPRLFTTLAETEAHLFDILHQDPQLCEVLPNTKGMREGAESFDDRTYLRLAL